MSDDEKTRRGVLRMAGIAGAASIAGCMGGGGDETPTSTEPGSVTPLGYGRPTGSTETETGENPTVRIANLAPGVPDLSVYVIEPEQQGGGGYGSPGYGSPPGYGGGIGSPGGPGSPTDYGSPPGYGGSLTPPPGYGSPGGQPTSTTDTPTPGIGGQETETPTDAGFGYGTRTPTEFGTPEGTPTRTATGARSLGLGEHTPYVELPPGQYTLRIEAQGTTLFENPVVLRNGDFTIAVFGTEGQSELGGQGGYGGPGGYGGYGGYDGGGTDSDAIRPRLLDDDRSEVPEDSVRLTYVNGVPNISDVSIVANGSRPFPFVEHQARRTTEVDPGRYTIRVQGEDGPLAVFAADLVGGSAYTIFGTGYAPGQFVTPTPQTGGYGGLGGYGDDGGYGDEGTGTPNREDFRDDDDDQDDDDQDSITPIRTPEGGYDTPTDDGYGGYGGEPGGYGTDISDGYGRTPTPSAEREEQLFRPAIAQDVGDEGGLVTGEPELRLANVSPTMRAASLIVDGARFKGGLRFRRLSDYTQIPSSGIKHVVVKPPGDSSEPILDRDIYVGGGRFTAATVDGVESDEGVTAVRFYGAPAAPDRGRQATIGAFNAVPDVENLAVTLAGRTDSTIRRVPRGEAKQATISGGQRVIEVRRTGESGRGEILASDAIDFDPQTATTIFGSGYAAPGNSPGSVGFSMFTVLEDGDRRRNRLLSVSSDAFDFGGTIPTVHTCDGEDQSPPLSVTSVPNGAESLAILVDDPDAGTEPYLHWTCWNVPTDVGTIPAGLPAEETLDALDGAAQGKNGSGEVGYAGPCPPEGEDPHRYRFVVFALDTTLDLEGGADRSAFQSAIEGHVVQSTLLTGLYER